MYTPYKRHNLKSIISSEEISTEALKKVGITTTEDLLLNSSLRSETLLQKVKNFPVEKLSKYRSYAELLQISSLEKSDMRALYKAGITSLFKLSFPVPETIVKSIKEVNPDIEVDKDMVISWQKQALVILYTGKFAGKVMDGDGPVEGANVYCGEYGAITNEEGMFWFPIVPYGLHTVIIRAEGYKRLTRKVKVMPGQKFLQKFSLVKGSDPVEVVEESHEIRIRHFSADDKIEFADKELKDLSEGTLLQFREHYKNGTCRLLSVYRRRKGHIIEIDRVIAHQDAVGENAEPGDVFKWENRELYKSTESVIEIHKSIVLQKFGKFKDRIQLVPLRGGDNG